MTSIYLNNIFAEVYNAVIRKIYISLYDIKLSTKLAKAFYYRQSRICRNNVSEVKCLLFSQIKTLPLKAFKKKLYIGAKLVKNRDVITIGIKMHMSLTG